MSEQLTPVKEQGQTPAAPPAAPPVPPSGGPSGKKKKKKRSVVKTVIALVLVVPWSSAKTYFIIFPCCVFCLAYCTTLFVLFQPLYKLRRLARVI